MNFRCVIAGFALWTLVSCSEQPARNVREVPAKVDSPSPDVVAPPAKSATGPATARSDEPQPSDAAAVAAPLELLHPRDVSAGWISLFDGQSLFGWRPNNDPADGGANWRIEEGVIVADAGDQPGLLLTSVRFTDFELLADYRLEEGGNSGIFLRTIPNPENPAVDCYELNMCDTHPEFPTGSIVGRQRVESETPPEGEWHSFRIRVEGNQIVAKLDGRIVIDFVDDSESPRSVGFIGLQSNQGKIEFRNVALRPLGTVPLFDGETLAGWRPVPESKSEFKTADEAIHLAGGPGLLETEETWADFVLQCDVRTNARDVNSGVFFRAMPGTAEQPSGGYELQICNSFADGNRAKPNDYGRGFGTGAIMHRASARCIVADDKEWATLTLVADGPRFMTWVNGFATAQWVDDREPHENPREGQRLQAGHLSLQGHDKASDVSFRNLRILDASGENNPR